VKIDRIHSEDSRSTVGAIIAPRHEIAGQARKWAVLLFHVYLALSSFE
jgi:hypothetical protein